MSDGQYDQSPLERSSESTGGDHSALAIAINGVANTEHTHATAYACWQFLLARLENLKKLFQARTADEELVTELLSFAACFRYLSKISIPRALSYTFSIQVVSSTIMIITLSSDAEGVASATLVSIFLNSGVLIAVSPIFALGYISSGIYGEYIAELKQDNPNAEKLKRLRERMASAFANSVIMAVLTGSVFTTAFYFSGSILEYVFRQPLQIALLAQNFLRPYSPAVFAMVFRMCCEQILFTCGFEVAAMTMGLSSLSLGIGLSYWLGFGGLGIPRYGDFGVSVGSVVEAYLTAILFASFIGLKGELRPFNFFHVIRSIKGRCCQLWELTTLGGSITFAIISEIALPIVTGAVAGRISTNAQAAWSYAMILVYLLAIPILAFGHQSTVVLNRYLDGASYLNASRFGKNGVLTTLIYTTPISLLGAGMTYLFSRGDAEVQAMTQYILPVTACSLMVESVRYNILQQLKPLGNKYCSSITSFMCLTLGMLASVYLGLSTDMGIYGVTAAYIACLILATLLLLLSWWQNIQPTTMQRRHEARISQRNRTCCFWQRARYENELPLVEAVTNYGTNTRTDNQTDITEMSRDSITADSNAGNASTVQSFSSFWAAIKSGTTLVTNRIWHCCGCDDDVNNHVSEETEQRLFAL